MQRDYSGRGRRKRLLLVAFLFVLSAVFLVSCMASSGVLFVGGGLLFEGGDLSHEATVRELSTDGVLAARLCEYVRGVADSSLTLPAFLGEREANARCREGMLFGMLESGYAAYVGNGSLIQKAERAYPHRQFLILIPAEDLEARAARYFGGEIAHGDCGAFQYLERVGMYTTPVLPVSSGVSVSVQSLVETEHTYRMTCSLTDGTRSGDVYTAIFEKREDGAIVWLALQ